MSKADDELARLRATQERMLGEINARPSENEWLLRMAETTALRATCSRLSVGAVLARDGRILSTGYNGAPMGEPHCIHEDDQPCTRSVHAEVNALAFAARHGVSTEYATLYLTHAPCESCAGLLINAGIHQVRFRNFYRSMDGVNRLARAGVFTYGGLASAGIPVPSP